MFLYIFNVYINFTAIILQSLLTRKSKSPFSNKQFNCLQPDYDVIQLHLQLDEKSSRLPKPP